jgi:hypothetical protein
MSSMHITKSLKGVAAIRVIQHDVAELNAARAAHDTRLLEEQAVVLTDQLDQQHAAYRACLEGAVFNPELSAIWANSVQRQISTLCDHKDLQTQATATLDACRDAASHARCRSDLATTMAERAGRRTRMRREETQLADMGDRLMWRRLKR